jgi:hypothetical protein
MRPFLVLASCGLVAAVVWYPWFMTGALARQGESGVKHFAHAPGVLALGLAFGLRLVLDYGLVAEKTRRQCARYVGIAGLVLGGCLDAFVMYQMVQLF